MTEYGLVVAESYCQSQRYIDSCLEIVSSPRQPANQAYIMRDKLEYVASACKTEQLPMSVAVAGSCASFQPIGALDPHDLGSRCRRYIYIAHWVGLFLLGAGDGGGDINQIVQRS
jgi:hypothetical protein